MSASTILRAARLACGLGQAELARRSSTSQSDVSLIESGKRKPTIATLERLLRATGHRLIAVPTDRSDAVETAELIAAGVRSGEQEWAFRRFLDYSDGLMSKHGVDRIALTLGAPFPTGSPKWDAAIAAVAEFWLDEEGLPKPSWLADPSRRLPTPERVVDSIYEAEPEPARTPAQFLERGLLMDRTTLASV